MALSTIGANQLVLTSADMPAGSILQVISSSSTDAVSTDTATFADIPFATATITPRATSSKILIQYSFGMMGSSGNSVGALMKLLRDSTEVGQGSGADTILMYLIIIGMAQTVVIPQEAICLLIAQILPAH